MSKFRLDSINQTCFYWSSLPDSVMERPNLFNYHQEPENHGILLSPWQSPFSAMLSQAFTLCQRIMWGQLKQKVIYEIHMKTIHICLKCLGYLIEALKFKSMMRAVTNRCYPSYSILNDLNSFLHSRPQTAMEERQSAESS